jgi:hypothetical protein
MRRFFLLHRAPFGALSLALLAGCAPPPEAPEIRSPADLDETIRAWSPPASEARSRAVASPSGPLRETRDLAQASPPPRRRRSGRRVDVELNHASVESALQLLASEGGVGLVLPDALGGPVSVSLHRVDPLEALVMLAEAQGLRVEQQDRLFIVRRR